jgi:hypothetical protein
VLEWQDDEVARNRHVMNGKYKKEESMMHKVIQFNYWDGPKRTIRRVIMLPLPKFSIPSKGVEDFWKPNRVRIQIFIMNSLISYSLFNKEQNERVIMHLLDLESMVRLISKRAIYLLQDLMVSHSHSKNLKRNHLIG